MKSILLKIAQISALGLTTFTTATAFALPRPGELVPTRGLTPLMQDDSEGSNDNYDYNGIAKLSNCSGALVRFENSLPSDKGMILTNGHCVPRSGGGFLLPNQFISNEAVSRTFKFLKHDGSVGSSSVAATKIMYATMTGTDMALYQLSNSFEQLTSTYAVDALTIASDHPVRNDPIEILSGYWQSGYSCHIEEFVFKMKEDEYFWNDSVRYSQDGCHTIHGTSGSPVISKTSGRIVAINNTGNDDGARCTMNNPCEISDRGDVSFKKGLSYAQQTYIIYSCLNVDGALDLATAGCKLFH